MIDVGDDGEIADVLNVHESIKEALREELPDGPCWPPVRQSATAGGSGYWETFLSFNLSIGSLGVRSYNESS